MIYCYGEYQSMFSEMKNVQFVKGLDESLVSRENLSGHTVLVIDDLSDSIDHKLIGALFTRMSHHRNISVIFLLNNLYYRGLKNMRDISLNTNYLVLFKSPRDQSSILTLARQLFGKEYKLMLDAYADAIKEKYGFLLIDSKAATPDIFRLRAKIFPDQLTVCYVPKNASKIA